MMITVGILLERDTLLYSSTRESFESIQQTERGLENKRTKNGKKI